MLDHWPEALGFALRWAADAVVIVLALRLGQRVSGAPLQIRTPLGLMWVIARIRAWLGPLGRAVVDDYSGRRCPPRRGESFYARGFERRWRAKAHG